MFLSLFGIMLLSLLSFQFSQLRIGTVENFSVNHKVMIEEISNRMAEIAKNISPGFPYIKEVKRITEQANNEKDIMRKARMGLLKSKELEYFYKLDGLNSEYLSMINRFFTYNL